MNSNANQIKTKKIREKTIILVLLSLVLFLLNLSFGSVFTSLQDVFYSFFSPEKTDISTTCIIREYRLPQAVCAVLAGIALSVSGLLLQTFFRNPLAEPSLLGVSSGASLGVALVILLNESVLFLQNSFFFNLSITLAAFLGAILVLMLILFMNKILKNAVSLLIVGLMIGYFFSSIISVLEIYGSKDALQKFVFWGLGSFSQVSQIQLRIFTIMLAVSIVAVIFLYKPLNALLLSGEHAQSLGINVKKSSFYIILIAGLLAGVVSAFCGPVAFIGIAVPHLAKNIFRSSNHKTLMPAVILIGASLALLCNLIAKLPGTNYILPINAVTSLLGAPLVIWIIVQRTFYKR